MKIKQFLDKDLAHLSYAIVSEGEIVLIDPARDPEIYFEFAQQENAKIVAVIETHPHADFISAHAELGNAGVKIYTSKLAGVSYPHIAFDEGNELIIGKIKLKALNTPGHSPDSISIVLFNEQGKEHAVFTGDTLFIGDVGRPDLRETAGNTTLKKEILAGQLYHSLRKKIMTLPDETIVFPAHGAGSLCGKSMSPELSSTIGQQKIKNYALQKMEERQFVTLLLENQPPIPKYFPYDVELNRKGAPPFKAALDSIKMLASENELKSGILMVDTRPQNLFKSGHLKGAINIQVDGKFETWLGSVVHPEEKFYLIAAERKELDKGILKAAKIGYEMNMVGALAQKDFEGIKEEMLDLDEFKKNPSHFTILDIREKNEVNEHRIFLTSINIPLGELRERKMEVPRGKPIIVHCAGGYRSAIGASLIRDALEDKVYDLGEQVKDFEKGNQI